MQASDVSKKSEKLICPMQMRPGRWLCKKEEVTAHVQALTACLLNIMPAKRLCDASSVLVGVELPIGSRFQPSPLASKLLAASRKGEHCASVSPCQYVAYPQQVLCSAFSRRQVLLGTVRPQHWICKGELVWPNGEIGGWGQEKSQWLLRRRRSYKNFSGCKCLHLDTLRQKSPGWRGGRTDMSTSRQHQQEATAARLRGQLRASAGCRRCWMAIPGPGRGDSTTLAGHLSRRRKTSNRNQVAAGLHQTCLREGKPKEKPGLRASHEPCHRRRRTVAHAASATHKTDCSHPYDTVAVQLFETVWCCPGKDSAGLPASKEPNLSYRLRLWPLWFDHGWAE